MTRRTRPIASIPQGALDLTGPAALVRRRLLRGAADLLERAGYAELIPPTFEYEETFLRAGGPEVAERLIRFGDRDGRDPCSPVRLYRQHRAGRGHDIPTRSTPVAALL